ncbi:hypothetical protein Glove_54g41 [Diversispora epigaea]|uniref:Mid2 domain-containing protein n=1 Tax=Diversispora epigaea TaxID=1348612 RepID=A0A397JNM3_9GLOM|nr:hypothetical protein Glove_54g41 [Diversispora epigaea]
MIRDCDDDCNNENDIDNVTGCNQSRRIVRLYLEFNAIIDNQSTTTAMLSSYSTVIKSISSPSESTTPTTITINNNESKRNKIIIGVFVGCTLFGLLISFLYWLRRVKSMNETPDFEIPPSTTPETQDTPNETPEDTPKETPDFEIPPSTPSPRPPLSQQNSLSSSRNSLS